MSVTEAYPESFDYKHEPDEWELLAYLADNLPSIRALLGVIHDRRPLSLFQHLHIFCGENTSI